MILRQEINMSIFEPIQLNNRQLQNRFVRSATCEYMGDAEGKPSNQLADLFRILGENEVGMIISGYAYVMKNGKSNAGQTGIYSDELIPAWKQVCEAVRETDAIALMQIVHGGRQVRHRVNPGPVWAPSAIADPVFKSMPEAMIPEQIDQVKQAFVDAAVRAGNAGFHGIQLHAAHGYLLSQFLSPFLNKRLDQYGGTTRNRGRLIVEILSDIRQRVPEDFIIGIKINGTDGVKGGLELNETIEILKILQEKGLDFIEMSGGIAEVRNCTVKPKIVPGEDEGYFRQYAKAVRRSLRLPVSTVGGFRSLETIEETIASGDADMVSLCRPLIREPDLIRKFRSGRQLSECVSCSRCLSPRGLTCWQLKS